MNHCVGKIPIAILRLPSNFMPSFWLQTLLFRKHHPVLLTTLQLFKKRGSASDVARGITYSSALSIFHKPVSYDEDLGYGPCLKSIPATEGLMALG